MVSGPPSLREIGAALGLSHTAIRKLRDKQQMPVDSIESARAWYALNGHHRGGAQRKSKAETAPETPVSTGELPDQGTLNRMLTAAKVRVTDLEAKQAEVDAQMRDGLLVKAETVKRVGFERAVALRNKLLALPAELAIQLAATTDPALVADLLRKRLKAALTEFCAAHGATSETR